MYFLVYLGVLRHDESIQLAHENRFVQVPHLWWKSDADSNAYANTNGNTNSYSDTNTNSYANPNTDASSDSERTNESRWNRCVCESD